MASFPYAWVEDARNLDNAEQLLHSDCWKPQP